VQDKIGTIGILFFVFVHKSPDCLLGGKTADIAVDELCSVFAGGVFMKNPPDIFVKSRISVAVLAANISRLYMHAPGLLKYPFVYAGVIGFETDLVEADRAELLSSRDHDSKCQV
jgi:hypothetical protein